MNSRIKNALFISVETVCFFTACMFFFGLNADAYIDPSVMTYVIQAVAAVVIAAGAAIGIIFRKTRKKINSKLGIDENKNKEVESDDILISENEKQD